MNVARDGPKEDSGPKKFAFLEYEIGGWGSLLALLISIATLFLTAFDRWVLDAKPILQFPEIINFQCDRIKKDVDGNAILDSENYQVCEDDAKLILVANPVTFINDTSAPHAFTVVSTDVVIDLQNTNKQSTKTIILKWFYFAKSEPIGPLTILPQMNIAKEINYYPRRKFDKDGNLDISDFLKYKDFLSAIDSDQIAAVLLTFRARLSGRKEVLESRCLVPVDRDFSLAAKKGQGSLISRECSTVS